jgi:hypothetical protein
MIVGEGVGRVDALSTCAGNNKMQKSVDSEQLLHKNYAFVG